MYPRRADTVVDVVEPHGSMLYLEVVDGQPS